MAPRPRFEAALDDAFEVRKQELGRAPGLDETETLRQQLFKSWMEAGRFDELIAYIHWYYELEGGRADCAILCEDLIRQADQARIEKLFRGLISVRAEAFWRFWPKAAEGHIGGMRESAHALSQAMDAYAGLWHGYWALKDEAGQARIQQEMLQLQQAVRPSSGKQRSKAAKASE